MARYIDADEFVKRFERELEHQREYGLYNHAKITEYVIKAIENEPTADVAPKSEVARLEQDVTRLVQENEDLKDSNEHLAVMLEETKIELEAMRGAANSYKMHYENLARKIFMDIDRVVEKYSMGDIEYPAFLNIIAEFKKKYTEGEG